jgi:hypothetical protein
MQNVTETILSQYANSPTITAIIEAMNSAIDPSLDIQNIYTNIWDVYSAVGNGLNILGAIVGVSRNLSLPISPNYFGFYEQCQAGNPVTNAEPFNQAPFYSGQATQTFTLSDAIYRDLILVKAFSNISNLSVPSINQLLQILFMNTQSEYVVDGYVATGYIAESGYTQYAYLQDGGDMSMTVVFNFTPTPIQVAILTTSGAFPRPCGVSLNYVVIPSF